MKPNPNNNPERTEHRISLTIPVGKRGSRLDSVLAELLPDYSRARLQQWIKQGKVTLGDQLCRPRDSVQPGQIVVVQVQADNEVHWQAEPIPLNIVFEDEAILVLNKPAGIVVHPAAGNWHGTLCNALLHYAPELEQVPRAGIVHRLDKDTSGLLVVAKLLSVHHHLVSQLQARSMKREYLALVNGALIAGGEVAAPIGRHPLQRKRMAVVASGKPALTHYRIEQRFARHTLLRVQLETGRTHQIRVHLAHIHYPVFGDPVYGGRLRLPIGGNERMREVLQSFKRQALHATRLTLQHPQSGLTQTWQVDLPEDMQVLLDALRCETEPPLMKSDA